MTLEPDLQIIVKGISEEASSAIGSVVAERILGFEASRASLDLRRMHRVILTGDLDRELAELSPLENPISYTNEDYGVAGGKVLVFPHDHDYEILLVLVAALGASLWEDLPVECRPETRELALHVLDHELCHVHDFNKRIDAFHELAIKRDRVGKDAYMWSLADSCWSEFIAQVLSSATATESVLRSAGEVLADAIPRTKRLIDEEILAYRSSHHDLARVIEAFFRHGQFLIISAAYVIGLMEGLGKQLPDLPGDADRALAGSYLESTWTLTRSALQEMMSSYPARWDSLEVYRPLADAMESYFGVMGLVFEDMDEGVVYLHLPLRPETMPLI